MSYLYRGRDRALMQQTQRDVALTLQRDYQTFNPAKTTTLSNKITIYQGYVGTFPSISVTTNTSAWQAFNVLAYLLSDLSYGSYETPQAVVGVWPVNTITWNWIQAVYANYNPAYNTWCTANGIVFPPTFFVGRARS